jgi:hypothetical protein
MTKVMLDMTYFRYLAMFIFDNKISDMPKNLLATVMPIILPTPNNIRK